MIFRVIFIFLLFCFLPASASSDSLVKGYITNKAFNPLTLKVLKIGSDFFYLDDKNLEDESYVPHLNQKITAENLNDYSLTLDDNNIFIPESTKFSGYISDIQSARKFDKKGFYKVTFDEVTCPNGETHYLKNQIISKSERDTYNPFHHIGKTTLSLLGGSLAGALFSYQLGSLGLAIATHGYSLAVGAAAGGFIGTASGLVSSGKNASVEPGNELILAPVDEVSLEQLKQIACKKEDKKVSSEVAETPENKNVQLDILSIKEKKDLLGDSLLKIEVRFTNNTDKLYRLSNFFLRDSQGKEYTTSIIDVNQDPFIDFPPKQTIVTNLEFFIDHPKAQHWLVLKDKNFSEDIASWKIVN